jgi:hypothetical protein
MKKIPTIFKRNDRLVINEMVPGTEWVLSEGVATRKYDGACCAVIENVLYKRYDLKSGREEPNGFIGVDPVEGHYFGWVPITNRPEDKWFRAAFAEYEKEHNLYCDTYEAIGPHFNNNPENVLLDTLVPHGMHILENVPRDFEGLKEYLRDKDIEGIVFWHPDGRKAKIKKKDFGLKRK